MRTQNVMIFMRKLESKHRRPATVVDRANFISNGAAMAMSSLAMGTEDSNALIYILICVILPAAIGQFTYQVVMIVVKHSKDAQYLMSSHIKVFRRLQVSCIFNKARASLFHKGCLKAAPASMNTRGLVVA